MRLRDYLFLGSILLILLNALDALSTIRLLLLGIGKEANPVAVYLWSVVGFNSLLLMKLVYPIFIYLMALLALHLSETRKNGEDYHTVRLILSAMYIGIICEMSFTVANNLILLGGNPL